MTPTPWTEDRWAELCELRTLLNEVRQINNGSDCLGRIARSIETAERLTRPDFRTPRKSFMLFLEDMAVESQSKPEAP